MSAQEGDAHSVALAKKAALRRRMVETRKAMTCEERERDSQAMIEKLCALPQYQAARTVFAYASMTDEVQLDRLIERALDEGKRVTIPWLPGRRSVMEAVELDALAYLEVGTFGIRNVPKPRRHLVNPKTIDLVVVPGAAFSPDGARLGLGGGYYDRFLGAVAPQAYRAALTFDALLVADGDIPMEPHDVRVDAILTETQTLFIDRERRGRREDREQDTYGN